MVIQVDFAENYTTQIQNAIQSSYWVSKQFTLFTVCAWEKNGCHSIVITLDYLSQNNYAVLAFMSMLVDHLKHIKEFNRYIVFSDGAPTQFKQKFTMCGMTLLQQSLSWNSFATSHGKGAVNGIGGRIKCDIYNTTLGKGLVIKNLDDFVDVAEHCSKNVTILKCTKKHVLSTVKQVDEDISDSAGIPGTHKMHCVKVLVAYMIETKEHYYSIKAPSQHTFKSSVKDTPDSSAVDHQYQKIENIESVSKGQWLLVEYEKEFFLGIVLSVSASSAHFRCLEKPYGISEPQDLEKENISIW